jgi:hypothetical protein
MGYTALLSANGGVLVRKAHVCFLMCIKPDLPWLAKLDISGEQLIHEIRDFQNCCNEGLLYTDQIDPHFQ